MRGLWIVSCFVSYEMRFVHAGLNFREKSKLQIESDTDMVQRLTDVETERVQ